MKHIFIINPKAGKGDGVSRIYEMADALREKHDLECSCILTQSPGHATALTRSMAETGEELRFYACGGDGTINEVANGAAGFANAAMTAIPIGTGNDFLKNFGPDQEKFRDAENLFDGPVTQLDLIDCNGRLALTIACSGLDARVAADVHRFSANSVLDGKSSYIASLAVNFLFKDICSHWTLTLDGVEQTGAFALAAVCNGRYYGGGFMPVPEASMTDGVLNTLVVGEVTRPLFLRFVGPYSKGEYHRFSKYAHCHTAKEVHITSEREDIVTCLDGEILRTRDVRFRLSEKKLNFFAPAGADPDATCRR
ncbi:MAG: diacylglycerol/lipid kinase family protein [Oscillospiraceae bacterium]